MRKDSIAVIGDKDSVLAFKAIGISAFPITDEMEAREKMKALVRNFKVIFVVDTLAEKIQDLLDRYKEQAFPAIIPIPSVKGSNGLGMANIKKNVEKAIGTDIIFGNDDK